MRNEEHERPSENLKTVNHELHWIKMKFKTKTNRLIKCDMRNHLHIFDCYGKDP